MDNTEPSASSVRAVSMLNALFGAWLIISPYILTYTTAQAKWEQTIGGIVVIILAGIRYMAPRQMWASWLNTLIGVWMVIAPFATGYQASAAYWNEVIFGVLLIVFGLANASTRASSHHGAHHAT